MKVQLLSDLHNEFYRPDTAPEIEQTDADLIVLAGDIDVGLDGLVWASKEAERLGKRILYIAGNHEFYHHDIALLDTMREVAAKSASVDFLENDCLVIDGVRFLGCTLWTDYRAVGDRKTNMDVVQQSLNDHHVVRNGDRLFLPEDALLLHQQSRAWLEGVLSRPFDGETVVITHHGPHMLCQHPSYPMSAIGTAFLSDLSGLVELADIWCFGHTHANLDATVGKCRLVSNQRGYPMEGVSGFDPVFALDIEG
jgi:predicted phosphodiesterase